MPAETGPFTPPIPATASVHDRCLQALAVLFKNLALVGNSQPGNVADNIYVKSLAELSDVQLPAVIVTTEGGEELLDQETFESRCWGYPCAVLLVDSTSVLDPKIRPDFLNWRHALMVAVDEAPASTQAAQFFADVPECWAMTLRPRSIFEEQSRSGVGSLPGNMVLVSSFVVLCHCNEARQR